MGRWKVTLIAAQIRHYKRHSAGITLAVAAGVFSLLLVLGLLLGLEEEMQDRLLRLTPHLRVEGVGADADESEVQRQLQRIAGVEAAAPFVELVGAATGEHALEPVWIRGVVWSWEDAAFDLQGILQQGHWADIQQDQGLLIGDQLAEQLRVGVSGVIDVTAAAGAGTFPVAGIFSSGHHAVDMSLVMMGREAALRLSGDVRPARGWSVQVQEPRRVDDWILPVQDVVNAWVRPWHQQYSSFYVIMQTASAAGRWLSAAVLLGLGYGIGYGFYLRTLDRYRVIGVLRSLGISMGQLVSIWALQGLFLGAVGAVVGTMSAFLVSGYLAGLPLHVPEVYYTGNVPMQWPGAVWPWLTLAAPAVAALAAAVPAWNIARQEPGEVIKDE